MSALRTTSKVLDRLLETLESLIDSDYHGIQTLQRLLGVLCAQHTRRWFYK